MPTFVIGDLLKLQPTMMSVLELNRPLNQSSKINVLADFQSNDDWCLRWLRDTNDTCPAQVLAMPLTRDFQDERAPGALLMNFWVFGFGERTIQLGDSEHPFLRITVVASKQECL